MTFYDVLGLPPTASHADLRRSYLRAARRVHPDVHATADVATRQVAEDRMRSLNEVWSVLGNADRRRAYDQRMAGGQAAAAYAAAPTGQAGYGRPAGMHPPAPPVGYGYPGALPPRVPTGGYGRPGATHSPSLAGGYGYPAAVTVVDSRRGWAAPCPWPAWLATPPIGRAGGPHPAYATAPHPGPARPGYSGPVWAPAPGQLSWSTPSWPPARPRPRPAANPARAALPVDRRRRLPVDPVPAPRRARWARLAALAPALLVVVALTVAGLGLLLGRPALVTLAGAGAVVASVALLAAPIRVHQARRRPTPAPPLVGWSGSGAHS